MKCKHSLQVLFLVLFLLLQSVFLFGQSDEKADITKAELMTLLDESEYLKNELKDLKQNYETLDQKYLTLDGKYETLELDLHKLKIESSLRTDSLTTLKKETALNFWKGFLSGFGVGFGTGGYAGLSIKLSL